jgi:hypothetical protein
VVITWWQDADGWAEGEGGKMRMDGRRDVRRERVRWLSRFKLIRLRRISLATFAAFGGAHNE